MRKIKTEEKQRHREKECKKRMTIILPNAYKQHPCVYIHIYLSIYTYRDILNAVVVVGEEKKDRE